jgi:lysophospholipase L1-like esterase
MLHKWYKNVVFSLTPLIIFISILEITFSFLPHKDRNDTLALIVEPDENLIWRLKRYRKGPLKTNELGLRDTSYNPHADIKILLLGDSISWGDGITDLRKCYPYILQKKLGDSHRNKSFEVINASVPGYSTFQHLKYLELYGLQLKPDLILLQFCLNDVFSRYLNLAEYGGDNIVLGVDTRKAVSGIYGWLLRHSRTFETLTRFLKRRFRNYEEYNVAKLTSDQLSDELEAAWQQNLNEIGQIHQTSNAENTPLMLILAPYYFQLSNPEGVRQPQDRIIAYAQSKGLTYIDLLVPFAQYHRQHSHSLFNDENHFSEYGHQIAAEVIFGYVLDYLEKSNLL